MGLKSIGFSVSLAKIKYAVSLPNLVTSSHNLAASFTTVHYTYKHVYGKGKVVPVLN
jgi:hypothetical protein